MDGPRMPSPTSEDNESTVADGRDVDGLKADLGRADEAKYCLGRQVLRGRYHVQENTGV